MAQELQKSELFKNKILTKAEQEMKSSDYMVAFSGMTKSYCICIVDMYNSTKISANMNEKDWSKYYSTFLNSMAKMIPKYVEFH